MIALKALLFRRSGRASTIGVPLRTSGRRLSNSLDESLLGSHQYRVPWGRVFRREIGNFYRRIRVLLETRVHARLLIVDPLRSVSQDSGERQQARDACIEDMRKVFADRPWLTAIDAEMFVRAWRAGAEWSARNHCISPQRPCLDSSGNTTGACRRP